MPPFPLKGVNPVNVTELFPLQGTSASELVEESGTGGQNQLNAPVGQISITSWLFVFRILLKSSVRGSEIILTKPLLMKQSAGSSFLSSHNLTQSPHLIHFAFSKINPLLALIFFTIGNLQAYP